MRVALQFPDKDIVHRRPQCSRRYGLTRTKARSVLHSALLAQRYLTYVIALVRQELFFPKPAMVRAKVAARGE
jgi:hypothetical protein